jgi:hypothetical protein
MYICVDFDGTCVTHNFPELGKDIGAVPVLKKLVNKGHKLILFTMRSDGQEEQEIGEMKIYPGDFLTQAVNWFKENDIELYGIQRNPTQDEWTSSPKAYGQLYIDDAALGCPLIYPKNGDRPYVNWELVEQILISRGIL